MELIAARYRSTKFISIIESRIKFSHYILCTFTLLLNANFVRLLHSSILKWELRITQWWFVSWFVLRIFFTVFESGYKVNKSKQKQKIPVFFFRFSLNIQVDSISITFRDRDRFVQQQNQKHLRYIFFFGPLRILNVRLWHMAYDMGQAPARNNTRQSWKYLFFFLNFNLITAVRIFILYKWNKTNITVNSISSISMSFVRQNKPERIQKQK